MSTLFQFPRLFFSGKGRLARIEALLDDHSRFIENIEPEDRITLRKTARGSIAIGAKGGAAAGGIAGRYRSFFRVVDSTALATCKVGVTSGGDEVDTDWDPYCGTVKVSGVRCDVPSVEIDIESEGSYRVWIHSWIDVETGPHAAMVLGDADDNSAPNNPNGGIASASQLAGRVIVEEIEPEEGSPYLKITGITQDYLRGGDHSEEVWGICSAEIVCPEPEEE